MEEAPVSQSQTTEVPLEEKEKQRVLEITDSLQSLGFWSGTQFYNHM